MADGNNAKPDAVLRRDAVDFKTAFDQDIEDCVEFFQCEMGRLAGEREDWSKEFLEEKDDAVAGIGNTFEDLEKRWIDMISKIKENFLNSVELFFGVATVAVAYPTSQNDELTTELSFPIKEETDTEFKTSPASDKGTSSPEIAADWKAKQPAEQPNSKVDLETSRTPTQDNSSSSESDDNISETLDDAIEKGDGTGFAVNEVDTYNSSESSASEEDDEGIILDEVPTAHNNEDQINGTDRAFSGILETSEQRKDPLELAHTEPPKVVVAETNKSTLDERETRSHNTRKRKTYDVRDGAARASVRKKSVVKSKKPKITLLDFLKDESVSKYKKRKWLMENVGDIHCSVINKEILEDEVNAEYLTSVIAWANKLLKAKEIVVFLQQVCTHIGSWHKTNLLQALLEAIQDKAYFSAVVEKAFTQILRYHNEAYDFKNCIRWGISGHGSGKGKVIVWSNRDSLQLLWRKMDDRQRRSLTIEMKKCDLMVEFKELGDLSQGKVDICAECCNSEDFDQNGCNNSK